MILTTSSHCMWQLTKGLHLLSSRKKSYLNREIYFVCVLRTRRKICFIMKEAKWSGDYLAGRWISTSLSPAGFDFNSSISNSIIRKEPNEAVLKEFTELRYKRPSSNHLPLLGKAAGCSLWPSLPIRSKPCNWLPFLYPNRGSVYAPGF